VLIDSIQVFARKLIRPFGDITVGDVENEIRAAEKLCKPGAHRNIVAVTEHGKFHPGYYFLDMELCDLSLENYIQRRWTPLMEEKVPYFTAEIPSRMRMAHIWDVMEDVTRGVTFIHQHKEIHRDLKPRNSMTFSSSKC
jgi:serine/threonine protein kinase